ncbi:calycin-like domain-containing protein [Prevotella stercorea]|uniref:calycin-like domain-containing protein n=1 Tax=Leyella stercorea TaxID=363265 RepID=UPI001F22E842|nr:calycin-like domain-containing protein [Leyella stercorea]MCF2645224.1 calycin-like domain-containing protein [Leyella stercorea]
MKRFLLPAFALALAVNANATSFQANMFAEQQTKAQAADGSKTFSGDLSVYMDDGSEMGTTEKSQILVTKESDGTYTFVLKDFTVDAIYVGDATISKLEGNEKNGVITLEATDVDAVITNGLNGTLGINKVVMSMTASIQGDYMVANISKVNVPMEGKPLIVSAKFASKVYDSITLLDSFEDNWVKCIPWDSNNNKTAVGKTPSGWCVSNVYTSLIQFDIATREGGSNSDYAVKLKNTSYFGQKIPAYMTLGTSWATAKGMSGSNPDGGSFGGKEFNKRPDAIRFDYLRNTKKGKENATVVAYLWKGTYTQKDVPGNTAIYGDPKPYDMTDRDRNILGMPTDQGGDVTKAPDAECIATINYAITSSTNGEWETLTIPFEYKTSSTPEKINIIFAATDYFDRTKIVADNYLCVDNVKYVYYHSLSDIKLNGTTIDGFNENRTEYTVKGNMSDYKNALDCTLKSANSTKDVNWNDAKNLVTITVKGSNYAEDNESMTVYTIKFEGTGTGIHNVTSTSTNSANGAIYDLSGRQLKTMQKGINIVRGKDGKMIKVMK